MKAFLGAALLLSVSASASELSDIVARTLRSTVGIVVDAASIDPAAGGKLTPQVNGSGVVVGPGIVATCAHVVRPLLPGAHISVAPDALWAGGEGDTLSATLLDLDEALDLALLRAERLKAPAVNVAPTNLSLGDAVFVVGRPYCRGPLLGLATVAGYDSRLRPGLPPVKLLGINGAVASGNSGGGVFSTSDGALLGIVSQKLGRIDARLDALLQQPPTAEIVAGDVSVLATQRLTIKEISRMFASGYGWAIDAGHVDELLRRPHKKLE